MTDQKKVLEHCVNFNNIVNCEFLEDDVLTMKLISYYQDFVFNINSEDKDQIDLIKKLDKAMHKYVQDYRFAKSLKETLDVESIIKSDFPYLEQLMKYIIEFLDKYEKEVVEHTVETKWI
ncbi:MAG: hypothetical protein PHQ89_01255 [Bacilli bacterium]|nr:hypothetical protein [Bacilli bacterium]